MTVLVPAMIVGALAFPVAAGSPQAVAGTSCPGGPLTGTSNADTATAGTLRTVLTTASGVASAQTICIDTTLVTAPIVIGSDLPVLSTATGPLTILGNGATVDGTGHRLIEDASSEPLQVDSITLTDGRNSYGGAIRNGNFPDPGSVTLTNSTITDSSADSLGGGIFVGGHGNLTVRNSTISGNTATNAGGGMEADAGVTVVDSTISGNSSPSEGGGIFSEVVSVTNSTITDTRRGRTAAAASSRPTASRSSTRPSSATTRRAPWARTSTASPTPSSRASVR